MNCQKQRHSFDRVVSLISLHVVTVRAFLSISLLLSEIGALHNKGVCNLSISPEVTVFDAL
jgi:hypothetical protein